MDIQTLNQKYAKITVYFDHKYPKITREFKILARLGKITEELGELNSAVHAELNLQREEKQAAHSFDQLELEWADVFNTVMLFAPTVGIDPETAIAKRLKDIYARYGIPEEKST